MTSDVDVIIPVRNGGRLLSRAVDSVLAQEGVSVRAIVVDDGSTDGAPDKLPPDSRIVVIPSHGRGVPGALNTGLAHGTATYIARQDADDESMPGRLARQVEHLEANPGIGMVGTAFEVVVGRRTIGVIAPMPRGLLDKNPFCAGSVVLRRQVLEAVNGYRTIMAEDYDLALRCATISGVSILPFVGYRYRLSADMSTVRRASRQRAYADLVRASARARLDGRPDPVDEVRDVDALGGDAAADLEVNAWWAREFAALGARREAMSCLRRLPISRAARLLPQILGRPAAQGGWS